MGCQCAAAKGVAEPNVGVTNGRRVHSQTKKLHDRHDHDVTDPSVVTLLSSANTKTIPTKLTVSPMPATAHSTRARAELPQWQPMASAPGQPDVPAMSLVEACRRTLDAKENVIPSVQSAHASAAGKQLLRQLQKCKGHEPAGGHQKALVNENLLVELSCLYPEAPKELLRHAAGCSRLEDAIDMITDSLAIGAVTPAPKQEIPQPVPAAFEWPAHQAASIGTSINALPVVKTEPAAYEGRAAEDRETLHAYEVATMSSPTWCAACGTFLWGISNQGRTCKRCSKTVCRPCSDKEFSQPCGAVFMDL